MPRPRILLISAALVGALIAGQAACAPESDRPGDDNSALTPSTQSPAVRIPDADATAAPLSPDDQLAWLCEQANAPAAKGAREATVALVLMLLEAHGYAFEHATHAAAFRGMLGYLLQPERRELPPPDGQPTGAMTDLAATHGLLIQAMIAQVAAEAYGMTGARGPHAQAALDCLIQARLRDANGDTRGWGANIRSDTVDALTTAWCVEALSSARVSDLDLPDAAWPVSAPGSGLLEDHLTVQLRLRHREWRNPDAIARATRLYDAVRGLREHPLDPLMTLLLVRCVYRARIGNAWNNALDAVPQAIEPRFTNPDGTADPDPLATLDLGIVGTTALYRLILATDRRGLDYEPVGDGH